MSLWPQKNEVECFLKLRNFHHDEPDGSAISCLKHSYGELQCQILRSEGHVVIFWHYSLHTCCYSHCYLGRCCSKPNCCLDRATFGGHPLTGPPASLFRLPKLALSVICAPVTTAAVAVTLVQCGNAAGDMASKGKQRETQPVKRKTQSENTMTEKNQIGNPHSQWKGSCFFYCHNPMCQKENTICKNLHFLTFTFWHSHETPECHPLCLSVAKSYVLKIAVVDVIMPMTGAPATHSGSQSNCIWQINKMGSIKPLLHTNFKCIFVYNNEWHKRQIIEKL